VPRESPLGLIALENMTRLTHAGATILPSMPGFYHNPASIADLIDFIVARICDHLAVEQTLMKRWGADD
jgi:flavin prenyltransferase